MRIRFAPLFLLAALAFVAAAPPAAASGAAPTTPLSITLASPSAWLGADDDLVVRWTITNESSVAVPVASWQLPADPLDADLFEVERDGRPVRYRGRLVKRRPPGPHELVTIAPGESLSGRVELSAVYDLAATGEYVVRYRADAIVVLGTAFVAAPLASNPVAFYRAVDATSDGGTEASALEFDELADVESGDGNDAVDARTPTWRTCSASKRSQVVSTLGYSQAYADDATSYLAAGRRGARYSTWFGAYSSGRYATARTHFSAIASTIRTKPLTFDCTCREDWYAYVYPDQPYVVYLCNAFWTAPKTGSDSKAGTIVHELSHFDVVAGTDDWAYGASACRALASSNPSRAVANADSHEYFAENTPPLD